MSPDIRPTKEWDGQKKDREKRKKKKKVESEHDICDKQ